MNPCSQGKVSDDLQLQIFELRQPTGSSKVGVKYRKQAAVDREESQEKGIGQVEARALEASTQ